MIRRAFALGALCALPLALAACGGLPDGVIAQVDGQDIPQKELDRALAQQRQQSEQAGQPMPEPGSDEYKELQRNIVAEFVYQRLILAEAKRCGKPCVATQAQITKRLNEIIKTNFKNKPAEFNKFLKESNVTKAEADEIVRYEIEEKRVRERITKNVRYTRAEALKYCAANPDQFRQAEQRTASHILVKDKATAESIYAQASGYNFADLARQYSIDPGSKGKGGSLGAISKGSLVAPFERVAFRLKDGEISRPVKTQFGWHVITVDITPARKIPCAEVVGSVRQQQLQSKREQKMTEWKDQMLKKYEDTIVYASDDFKPAPPAPLPSISPQGAAPQAAAPQGTPAP